MTRKHKPAPAPRKPVARAAAAPTHRKSAAVVPVARPLQTALKAAEPHHKSEAHKEPNKKGAGGKTAAPAPAPAAKSHGGGTAAAVHKGTAPFSASSISADL